MTIEMLKELQLDIVWLKGCDGLLFIRWRGLDLTNCFTPEEILGIEAFCRENYPEDTKQQ